jgi:hypothetical protein
MRKTMKIQFKCKACDSFVQNEFREFKDVSFKAYEHLEWSEESNTVPHVTGEDKWPRSEIRPGISEYRVVRVTTPFCEESGSSFWVLYQPALSFFNGWDEHPEELDELAFLNCKIVEVIEYNDNHAWLKLKIVKSILLCDSYKTQPIVVETDPVVDHFYEFGRFDLVQWKGWFYYFGGSQGDLGNWFLLKQEDTGMILIAFGEWGFHQECSYFANVLVSDRTISTLNSWCS